MCREPRGIGFIEYSDPRDAEDAKFGLDRRMIEGREVSLIASPLPCKCSFAIAMCLFRNQVLRPGHLLESVLKGPLVNFHGCYVVDLVVECRSLLFLLFRGGKGQMNIAQLQQVISYCSSWTMFEEL